MRVFSKKIIQLTRKFGFCDIQTKIKSIQSSFRQTMISLVLKKSKSEVSPKHLYDKSP